jgi:HK97 family phage portal protein
VGLSRPPSSGRYAERALIPRDPLIPNGNDPADVPPATVGPDVARPGDPDGVDIVTLGDPVPGRNWPPPPSHWSGYPAEWATSWDMGATARLEDLSDIAWGCVDLNANVLATMPPYLTGAAASLDASWLANPDPDIYTDWAEFAKQLFWDFQLGEAFVLSTARYDNGAGYPARFHVVAPWLVNVEMDAGRRRYSIGDDDVTGEIRHLRYKGRADDARGHGPLDAGRGRVIAANVLSRYATNLATAGGVPSSILTAPGDVTAAQAADLRDQWLEARLSNLGLPAVLSGGLTWQATQINPKDMALIELLGFNEARMCVLLGVPPSLMALPSGETSMLYKNQEGIYDFHWRSGLRPRAALVMGGLSEWLLPRGTAVELNRDAYVQPGPLERAQTWQILTSIGVLDAGQVAQIERYVYHGEAASFPVTAGPTL